MASWIADPSIDVGLVTNDIEGQSRFYGETLGLETLGHVEIPGVGTIARFSIGTSVLRLMVPVVPAGPASRDGGFAGTVGIRYVALKVTGLAELVRRVRLDPQRGIGVSGCEIFLPELPVRNPGRPVIAGLAHITLV